MRVPTLHLNGSSADNLKADLCEAAGTLRAALRAMAAAAPNARDYYIDSVYAYPEARGEHERRLKSVRAVLGEYEQILEGLQDQIDARAARRGR